MMIHHNPPCRICKRPLDMDEQLQGDICDDCRFQLQAEVGIPHHNGDVRQDVNVTDRPKTYN